MLGLECRFTPRGDTVLENLSWMSTLSAVEIRGLLHGFDGFGPNEGYDVFGRTRDNEPCHSAPAYEFGARVRELVENHLGGVPWAAPTADPTAQA